MSSPKVANDNIYINPHSLPQSPPAFSKKKKKSSTDKAPLPACVYASHLSLTRIKSNSSYMCACAHTHTISYNVLSCKPHMIRMNISDT